MIERFLPRWSISSELVAAPDGRSVFFVANVDGEPALWALELDQQQGLRLVWRPEGKVIRGLVGHPSGRLYVSADQDGDEACHLYEVNAAGDVRPLLVDMGVQFQVERGACSPDGRHLALASNAFEPESICVYLYEVETGTLRCIREQAGHRVPVNWSRDGRYLLVSNLVNGSDVQLEVFDHAAGTLRPLTDAAVDCAAESWCHDSAGCYVTMAQKEGFRALWKLDVSSGTFDVLEAPAADIQQVAASPDGHWLVWVVNAAGVDRLAIKDLNTQAVWMPDVAGLVEDLLFCTDNTLLVVLSGFQVPSGIVRLEPAERTMRWITPWLLPEVKPESLVHGALVQYPSFDGRMISGFLYRPNAGRPMPMPVLLALHGGPEEQEKAGYSPLYQCLVARGIGVFAPNIRGSSGFGREFQELVRRDWGGGDLRDVASAVHFLQEQPWVASDRLAVCGASYGGYLATLAAGRMPEKWRAVVDLFGPTNLVNLVRNVPEEWQRFIRDVVGDPDEDFQQLTECSPITYADQIVASVLVVHGQNDPRVPLAESDQLVNILQRAGRDVDYVVIAGEGHGFMDRAHQVQVLNTVVEFLCRHLLGAASG